MAVKRAPLKKHQQINKTQKMMFIWVAIASAVIGFAVVANYFIIHKAIFAHKVLAEKNQTVDNLKNNNEATEELIDNIKALETNQALNSTKVNENSKAIQSVLDALPVNPNEQALGASLQSSLLAGVDGAVLENLTIEAIATVTNDDESSEGSTSSESSSQKNFNKIDFSFTVTANSINSVQEVLNRLERSIRIIQIDELKMEISRIDRGAANGSTEDSFEVKVQAHAYFKPAQKIELKKKEIKP